MNISDLDEDGEVTPDKYCSKCGEPNSKLVWHLRFCKGEYNDE